MLDNVAIILNFQENYLGNFFLSSPCSFLYPPIGVGNWKLFGFSYLIFSIIGVLGTEPPGGVVGGKMGKRRKKDGRHGN